MKYYSEEMKRFFDTEEECMTAEAAYEEELENARRAKAEAAERRKARAQEVELARDELIKARDNFNKVLNDFCKDYGTYHFSINESQSLGGFFKSLMDLI